MKIAITTVALGGWYPRGVARMIEQFSLHSPGYEIVAWVNVRPPRCPPERECTRDGYDYSGYVAKPYALEWLRDNGDADIGLLLDASVFPRLSIAPIIERIERDGYYLVRTGFTVGEWASSRALKAMGWTREHALTIPEVASGVVGIDFRKYLAAVRAWRGAWPYFAGPHSNSEAADKTFSYRNAGHVSSDPRCRGHRHDQTMLSYVAWEKGMRTEEEFGGFGRTGGLVSYNDAARPEAVLIVRGM